ncbi:MAG: hypothetical protein IPK85_12555 [Gemmatimonadetes bacterium]|nr:hypothetical protein [Gemmatimonadota bacterium]
MYSTCLFCTSDLGSNEMVEEFPVGRRLAFDSRRGRLWVVCRSCRRWNLTAIEERWEAIEQCERLYRSTPLRVSTDNVGMTRLREGLELVRIGEPLRPEFASWRYLPLFEKRRQNVVQSAPAQKPTWSSSLWMASSFIFYPPMALVTLAGSMRDVYTYRLKTYAHVPTPGGRGHHAVKAYHLPEARLLHDDNPWGWKLEVEHEAGRTELAGPPAQRVLGRLLVAINATGGSAEDLDRAVSLLGRYAHADTFFNRQGKASDWRRGRRYWWDDSLVGALKNRAPSARLAIEMALHETVERAALEGELQSLREAWEEAEEIAAIADQL